MPIQFTNEVFVSGTLTLKSGASGSYTLIMPQTPAVANTVLTTTTGTGQLNFTSLVSTPGFTISSLSGGTIATVTSLNTLSANANIALTPQISGSITVRRPAGNTTLEGPPPGNYAVDLQRTGFVGSNCSAGNNTLTIGNRIVASTVQSAVLIGYNLQTFGSYSVILGSTNVDGGTYGFCCNTGNNVGTLGQSAFGRNGGYTSGEAGYFGIRLGTNNGTLGSNLSYNSAMRGMLGQVTTNATATSLFRDPAIGNNGNNNIGLGFNSHQGFFINGFISATSTTDKAMWSFSASARNDSTTFTVLDGQTVTKLQNSAGAAAWTIGAITINTTNHCIVITATGAAGVTITWSCWFEAANGGRVI